VFLRASPTSLPHCREYAYPLAALKLKTSIQREPVCEPRCQVV